MRDVLDLVVVDAESVTVRSVAGHGDQAELTIQTRRGSLTLRLISRPGRRIRLTDLRARDKKRRRRPFVSIPFPPRADTP
jgi:nitrogen regulatory protein PII